LARFRCRHFLAASSTPDGVEGQRLELVEREYPVGPFVQHLFDPSSLNSFSGSLDSFHVFVRWKVTSWRSRLWRRPSRPIVTSWTQTHTARHGLGSGALST
jgi:hypothetical protein